MRPSSTRREPPVHPYRRPAQGAARRPRSSYGPLRALVLSFFSADLYRDAAQHWRGTAFFYLALLLGVVWVSTATVLHYRFGKWAREEAPAVIAQIPPLSVKGGELSVEAEQPYFLTNQATGDVLVVIDTTGTITTLEQAGARVLLTKTEAIMEQNPREVRMYRFQSFGDFAVDQTVIQGWLNWFSRWLGFILFPFALAGSYFYRVVQVLFYGLFGLVFARILGVQLSYGAAVSLAILSITAPVLLGTVVQLTQTTIPVPWLSSFALAMGYLFFGVYSNRT